MPDFQRSSSPNVPLTIAIANPDWHTDGNSTSPEVDISYCEMFIPRPFDIFQPERLQQMMNFSYNDGTLCKVFFNIICTFGSGGLDFANHQILNWSKCMEIIPHFGVQSFFNDSVLISSSYQFNGFYIVNGTAADVQLMNMTGGTSDWEFVPDNVFAFIDYRDTTFKIGHVTLSTREYSYQNQTLNESIADFSVTINASIGVKGPPPVEHEYIPVALNFHLIHNVTSTVYKYGVDVNWSAHKDFPTDWNFKTLKTGDDFTLIAADGQQGAVYFMDQVDAIQLHAFQINDANDTVIFSYAGTEYCRLFLTTNYTIYGDTPRNTTRLYVENLGVFNGDIFSGVFVCFDGFKYNQSTGMAFDPTVKVPSFIPSGGGGKIGWAGFLLDILGLSLVAALIIWSKKRKPIVELSAF